MRYGVSVTVGGWGGSKVGLILHAPIQQGEGVGNRVYHGIWRYNNGVSYIVVFSQPC